VENDARKHAAWRVDPRRGNRQASTSERLNAGKVRRLLGCPYLEVGKQALLW
jgi:hypothetical protein